MKQITTIDLAELTKMSERMYGGIVKGVVDIKKRFLVLDAEMHADEEQFLLENGSVQADLWGINLHPDKFGTEDFIAFDSMINIRPSQKNMTRGVNDESIRKEIIAIVLEKVKK